MKHNSFASGVLSIVSRSDYDDMPSGGGGRRGKGNRGLTLGVLICILVVLIIIVVKLIVTPDEKLEVLPPNPVEKASVQSEEVDTSSTIVESENIIITNEESVHPIEAEDISEEIIDDESNIEALPEDVENTIEEEPLTEITEDEISEEIEIEEVSEELPEEDIPIESKSESITEEEIIAEENISEEEPIIEEASIEEPMEESPVVEEIEEEFKEIEESVADTDSSLDTSTEETIKENETIEILEEPIVEEDVEEPEVIEVITSPIIEEVEETPETVSFDPFPNEDVENLRKGLGELLAKFNFDLILAEEESPVEEAPLLPTEDVVIIEEEVSPLENKEESIVEESEEEIISEVDVDETSPTEEPVIEEVSSTEEETPLENEAPISKTAMIEEVSHEIISGSELVVEEDKVVLISTPGSAVKSPIDGVIIESKKIDGQKTISIEPEEGEIWRFSGFERVNVKLNDSIKKGGILGSVGSSSGSSISVSIVNL